MAKKKSAFKKWKEKYFGKKWGIWDIVLIIAIIWSGWYIYDISGLEGFFGEIASAVFYAVVVSFVVRRLIKKARKS